MKIRPITTFLPKWDNFLPNTKFTFKNLPKIYKIVPKWQNFAKSGHNNERAFTSSIVVVVVVGPSKQEMREKAKIISIV